MSSPAPPLRPRDRKLGVGLGLEQYRRLVSPFPEKSSRGVARDAKLQGLGSEPGMATQHSRSAPVAANEEKSNSVFISYGRAVDVGYFVRQLKRDLEANGFSVWLDSESIPSGSDWHGAIGTGLNDCSAFIPVITQKYIGSRFCMNELYTADGDKKLIFPIVYEDVDLVSTEAGRALKFIVSGINWTMFRPGKEEYSDSLQKLIKGMKEKEKKVEAQAEPEEESVIITVGPSSSEPLKMMSGIEYPAQIATGRNGEIVVASYMSHEVHIYSHDYQLLRKFGSQGYLDGQFMCPSGIAVDRHNRIFVGSMSKVDVFTMEGQFLTAFGQQGKGPLEFTNVVGVAVSKEGKVFVADSQNNRIQVINSDFTYCTSFAEACPTLGSGRLSQPQAIAVNSEGNIYVADMMNHAVQAFTPDGKFLLRFGKYGPATTLGAVCSPMAIAIDRQDNVYVGSGTGVIGIFDKEGEFLRQFGSYGSELGQFNTIKGLHIDRKGRLYVSEWTSNRIQIFPGSPSMEEQEGEEDTASEEPEAASESSKLAYMIGPRSSSPIKVLTGIREANAIAVGKNGEVIVASRREHKVFVYSPKDDYTMIAEIGGEGNLDGKFSYPSGVAVTSDNLVLVSSHYKLQWFTIDGKLVYGVGGRGKKQMDPTDITIGKDGRIYVIDSNNKVVQIFNGDATVHGHFGFPHLDSKNKDPPNALAINSEENLYFADSKNNCVHVFSSLGEALFKFGKSGSLMERGTLSSPQAIAIDGDDNVFVGSALMISIFDKSGSFIRGFGGHGSDPGQFNLIRGLDIGKNGSLYVCEYSNNRVQIFEGSEPSQSTDMHDAAAENVQTLSCRRPVHTIGPTSDMPAKVLSGIMEPWGIATASSNDIFIISKKGKKVVVHNGHDFEFKEEIGRLATRDGDMVDLQGIAISEDGCLLLSIQNQLVKITLSGEVIASVGKKGRRGKGDEELASPNGIAIGKDGQVYVVDKGNDRVQIFNAALSYRSTCHLPASQDRIVLEKVAVNSDGSVYVTDSRNHCVHVFNCDGKFLFSFGKKDDSSDRGKMSSPTAIAIDHEDYVYVSGSNIGVSIFDREGCYVRAFGTSGDKPGEFRDIKAMHIDHKGNLYVCESRNNRVQIFTGIKSQEEGEKDRISSLVQEEAKLDPALPVTVLPHSIREPHGIAEGMNGEIVVASSSEHKVFVYDCDHRLMSQFGGMGDLDGRLNSPTGVAVTSDNYILVSSHDKLQWFTMEGQLVYAIGTNGKEEMEFDHPDSITVGRDGRIYILERRNKRVQILKGDATYHSTFKLQMDQLPDALAVNSESKIFFANTKKNCIQIFSTEGECLSTLCNRGSKEIALPTAIATDAQDNVYVGNASGIIAVFNKEGHFLKAFRGSGVTPCQFSVITGLNVGKSGHVYVSEYSHNRVQVFEQTGALAPSVLPPLPLSKTLSCRPIFTIGPVSTIPVRVLNGIKQPSGIVSGRNDDIFVASTQDDKILMYGGTDSQPRWQISEFQNPRNPRNKRISSPSGLAFTSDSYLLVSFRNQLVKMAVNGTVVGFFGNETNRASKEDLNQPGGIAVGRDDQIYLVDRGNHRVVSFHSNLVYVTSFFNPDSKERSSEYLESVALNSAGDLYVTDRKHSNVHVYNPSGKFMFAFGKEANLRKFKRGHMLRPYAIAIDREDFVYVGGDDGIVSIFDKGGKFLRSFGGSGDQPGQFGAIHGMHIDNRGRLYVCEWDTNRVQVFQGHY